MNINNLWVRGSKADYEKALFNYYESSTVDRNRELENRMDSLDYVEIQSMNIQDFYFFLYDEYFRWKYTDGRWLSINRAHLEDYQKTGMVRLECIRDSLFRAFNEDPNDTQTLMEIATQIKGLGTAGASGLLAVLFPHYYGTIDQFVVYSLCEVENLPEHNELMSIRRRAQSLNIGDSVVIEEIFRRKAAELNDKYVTREWTPRKIDMILWSYRDN